MTFPSNGMVGLTSRELADFGKARVRDAAFDAVHKLWKRRKAEGITQNDLAKNLDRDPAWVSRQLRGPGNWTLNTFGELVIALRGEAEIEVCALEDQISDRRNYNAYDGYDPIQQQLPIVMQNKQFEAHIRLAPDKYSIIKQETANSQAGSAFSIKKKGR